MKKYGWLIGILAVIAIIAITIIPSYNGLVNKDEDVDQAYAQIENQLQRRLDLIPNLVNTVKGYASQEKEVIQSISDARANLAGAKTPGDQATANDQLTTALNRLLVVVENYPDLKSNQTFQQLMDELAGTENRIAVARKDYNDAVSTYNRSVKRFPGSIIAGVFNFDEKEYFKASEGADQAPTVDFGENDE
ncbi:LemA family protein [Bacillus sp. AGMB 02131]|uniref:LemA family protein n=1 Tax=Peribacillus faecalis TaxID=2772559 RepID=A0A927CWI8_9BACI|nr:LemA family protein [Peribacillus faecalis]MBD3109067.1 LemA family protein [Peribacillus faecalis]